MGDTDQPSGKSPRNLIALAALALSASLPLTAPSQAQNRGPQQGASSRAAQKVQQPRVQQPRVAQPGCADNGICGPKVRKRGAGIPGRPYNR